MLKGPDGFEACGDDVHDVLLLQNSVLEGADPPPLPTSSKRPSHAQQLPSFHRVGSAVAGGTSQPGAAAIPSCVQRGKETQEKDP